MHAIFISYSGPDLMSRLGRSTRHYLVVRAFRQLMSAVDNDRALTTSQPQTQDGYPLGRFMD